MIIRNHFSLHYVYDYLYTVLHNIFIVNYRGHCAGKCDLVLTTDARVVLYK